MAQIQNKLLTLSIRA